jgi:hypothetical protein
MNPISNKEAYHILKNVDYENNDFLTNIIDYLKVVVDYSHNIPMNELRKNKKLTSGISVLVTASNIGDMSILDKNDQDVIKNIVK